MSNPEEFIAETCPEALLQDVCKSLRADCEAFRKDAERYRWLRLHWFSLEAMTSRNSHAMVLSVTGGWPGEIGDNARLDAAIDAETVAEAIGCWVRPNAKLTGAVGVRLNES